MFSSKGLVLCLAFLAASVSGETFSECDNVPIRTFVASPKGCSYYIYCDGDDSFEDSCPTNLMFNVEDGSCDEPENVNCVIETTSTTQETTTTTTTPLITSLPPVTVTTTTTTTGAPVTASPTPAGQIICPQPSRPEEIIYLPSPEACSEYYMCYHGVAIPMTCPNDLQFNSLTASCDWAETANCVIIGTTTISPREKCTAQTSGYFAYPNNCRYYYRCTNGMLTIQECPVGFGWDANRKMCTSTGCST